MEIVLREIDKNNLRQCIHLNPGEDKQKYVAENVYSIAQSRIEPYYNPLAIYNGDTIVGFAMYALDPDDGKYWIYRFMIDEKFQGRGYGKGAMIKIIELLKKIPECREIMISYVPGNIVAEKLYTSLGFERTGETECGEIAVCLKI